MKKTVLFLACCFLLIPSAAASAQTKTAFSNPLQAYEEWKRNELGEKAETTKHYALAAISRRTSSDSAQLDVAAVGEMANGFMLEVQPVAIDQKTNGQLSEEVGELTRTSVTTANPQHDLSSPAVTKLILRVPANANALKIKWLFSQRVKGENGSEMLAPRITVLWVRLGDAPESAVAAVMNAPGK